MNGEDIFFTRLGFAQMLSQNNAPSGVDGIPAEECFSPQYKLLPGTPDEWIEPTIRDLRQVRLLRDDDQILDRNAALLPYPNVIFFDLDRAAALATVHGYLEEVGIAYCGRYRDWGHVWTDESFKSDQQAAEKMRLRRLRNVA